MTTGELEAINRIGPGKAGTGQPHAAQKLTVSSPATAFQAVPSVPQSGSGARTWVTLLPVGGDIHIAFGTPTDTAASTADRIFLANQEYDYEIPPGATGFTAIRDAAVDVTLYWHRSNL